MSVIHSSAATEFWKHDSSQCWPRPQPIQTQWVFGKNQGYILWMRFQSILKYLLHLLLLDQQGQKSLTWGFPLPIWLGLNAMTKNAFLSATEESVDLSVNKLKSWSCLFYSLFSRDFAIHWMNSVPEVLFLYAFFNINFSTHFQT